VLQARQQRLEVDVPDPGDVAAVGDLVVQRDDDEVRGAAVDERPDDLVRPGRVLDQEQQQLLALHGDPLEAAERRAEAREPVRDVVERCAQLRGERRGPDGVVDVVEPGERELDPPLALRRDEEERRALEPVELDLTGRDVERGARVVAPRAPVVAEVPDVRGGVLVRRPAADAVLRVGCVLEGRACHARVVEPERDAPRMRVADGGELWIVGVDHEPRLLRQAGDRHTPALGDQLELAVAVELVAEEVAETDGARPQAAEQLGQRAFVDLEQPELGTVLREQRRRHAGDEVRARRVVGEPLPRPQDLGRHRGSRRLAVRGRDRRRSPRQPCREPVDRVGIEPRDELPRDRRSTAGAEAA
jgi:hypothetical protein